MKHKAQKLFQASCYMLHKISRSPSRSFFLFTAAFLFGVALNSIILGVHMIFIIAGLSLSIFLVVIFWNSSAIKVFLLCAIFFFVGMARLELDIRPGDSRLYARKDERISFEGTVIKSSKGIRWLVLEASIEFLLPYREEKINDRILIFLPPARDYEIGEKLLVSCDLRESKEWPRRSPRWICLPESVRYLGRVDSGVFTGLISDARARFFDGLRASFPEPQFSLAGGLLLGNNFGFSQKLMDSFVRTGTAHIVAVSGWNVTMISNFVLIALLSLGCSRRRTLPALIVFIIFYALLTGGGSSIVRAGIMGAMAGTAWHIGRSYSVKNALAAAAVVMVFVSPRVLLFDAGFALSFAATAGLMIFAQKFKYSKKENSDAHILLWIKETTAQTAAAMVLTAPLILYLFGNFSFVAPLANLLILPVVPLATALSFLAACAGMISSYAGELMGLLAWLPLTYIIRSAEILAALPIASVNIGNLYTRLLILATVPAILAIRLLIKRRKDKSGWNIVEV